MTRRLVSALVIVGAVVAPGIANAQTASEPGGSTTAALLAEVRLLRQAIERQSSVTGRAQLLVGKLALQDQRVVRWHAETQRLESELSAMAQRRAASQARLAELRIHLETPRDAEQAGALESEARTMEAQLKQEAAQLAALEARRVEASQALEAERARYEELSDRLDRLERDLEGRPARP